MYCTLYDHHKILQTFTVADPGFPVGATTSYGAGCQFPMRLHFLKFVFENKRIGILRGRAPGAPRGSATANLQKFQQFNRECLLRQTTVVVSCVVASLLENLQIFSWHYLYTGACLERSLSQRKDVLPTFPHMLTWFYEQNSKSKFQLTRTEYSWYNCEVRTDYESA